MEIFETLGTFGIILIILILLVLGGIVFLGFFIRKMLFSGAVGAVKDVMEEFNRDKQERFKEQESLRTELRENARSMREDFHRVNKTVDVKLSESSKQLNERLDKSSSVIGNLQKELGKMGEIGSKIENLDKILRAPKGRGSMGEESLEEILRSIFPANLWERQFAIDKAGVVDAVVKTSNGIIPIDAKFPLENFERLVHAEDEESRAESKKAFARDMKKRIDETAKYIRPEQGTVAFSILFLPNENIYYEAAIRSGAIVEYAKSKNVLLTGPNTMLYVLQTIFQAYQSQNFAKQAQEALSQLTGVKEQAGRLDEAISVVGKHLGNANARLTDVQTENQKLQTQIEKVSTLDVSGEGEAVDQGQLL